jgi:hypothetical protein
VQKVTRMELLNLAFFKMETFLAFTLSVLTAEMNLIFISDNFR